VIVFIKKNCDVEFIEIESCRYYHLFVPASHTDQVQTIDESSMCDRIFSKP
jgi:hypothetical protein